MNLKSIVKATLVACCIYSGATVAATDRSATVSIMNLTGEPIVAAYSHKVQQQLQGQRNDLFQATGGCGSHTKCRQGPV